MKVAHALALSSVAVLLVNCTAASSDETVAADDAALAAPDGAEQPGDESAGDVVAGRTLDIAQVAESKAGDVLSANGVAVIVPQMGHTVTAIAELEDGGWRMLVVSTDESGTHATASDETTQVEEDPSEGATDAPPSACSDRAFSRTGHRWTRAYAWKFKAASTPAGVSPSGVEGSLKEAAANVASARNDCGAAGARTHGQRYLGRTTHPINIIGDANQYRCGQGDGQNVVGFGVLPRGYLGVACTWWSSGGAAVEADVKLNARGYRWFPGNAVPGGCSSVFSVEGVMTHEFGHVFGLGHVSEAQHGNLTMSTASRPCTMSDTTLGRGDVLGMRAIYGGL